MGKEIDHLVVEVGSKIGNVEQIQQVVITRLEAVGMITEVVSSVLAPRIVEDLMLLVTPLTKDPLVSHPLQSNYGRAAGISFVFVQIDCINLRRGQMDS